MLRLPLKMLFLTGTCLALFAFVGAAALAAKDTGKPAATKVTIENWPGGLMGEVASARSGRCADGRRVVVYRARGTKRDPADDDRVGAAKAKGAVGEFGWTVETDQDGRFYAQVPAKRGCAAALSSVIDSAGPGGSAAAAAYPICGTYISETMSRICRVENLTFTTFAFPGETLCLWDRQDSASNCNSTADSGPFPWFSGIQVLTSWKPDGGGRSLTINARQWDRPGVSAMFEGRVPDPNSQRFTVTEASAPGEGPVDSSSTDHFYTPDLPGTLVGEVGGPLKVQIQAPYNKGTRFTFNGYLYLKR
jgi:hypothetical protein